jgi:hypothetical protein
MYHNRIVYEEVQHKRINTESYTKSINSVPAIQNLEKINCEPVPLTIIEADELPEYVSKEYNLDVKHNVARYNNPGQKEIIFQCDNLPQGMLLGFKVKNAHVSWIKIWCMVEEKKSYAIAMPTTNIEGVYNFISPIPIIKNNIYILGISEYALPEITLIVGDCEFKNSFTGLIRTMILAQLELIEYKDSSIIQVQPKSMIHI